MKAQEKSISDPHYGSILQTDLFIGRSEKPCITCDTHTIPANTLLFQPGDNSESIYILHSGEAAIYVDSISQGHTISTKIEPGRMYGLLEAVGGDQMWYAMRTDTQCTFEVVRRDKFLAGLSNDPALCFRLAQILSRMNREILLSVAFG